MVENNTKALVRLIPRIPNYLFEKSTEITEDTTKKPHQKKIEFNSTVRIPQKLFNPSLVKHECRKEKFIPL